MLLLVIVGCKNEQLQKGNNINKFTVLFQQLETICMYNTWIILGASPNKLFFHAFIINMLMMILLESSKNERKHFQTLSLTVDIKERWWARCGRSRKFCQRTLSMLLFFTEYANIIADQIYYQSPAFQGLCSQTYLPSPAFRLGAPKNRGFCQSLLVSQF